MGPDVADQWRTTLKAGYLLFLSFCRWKDKPRHDWASHGADAFRYGVTAWVPHMKNQA